jgi:hypothetical protein
MTTDAPVAGDDQLTALFAVGEKALLAGNPAAASGPAAVPPELAARLRGGWETAPGSAKPLGRCAQRCKEPRPGSVPSAPR